MQPSCCGPQARVQRLGSAICPRIRPSRSTQPGAPHAARARRHNGSLQIEACATTLVRIFQNVIDNPAEDKYRRVRLVPRREGPAGCPRLGGTRCSGPGQLTTSVCACCGDSTDQGEQQRVQEQHRGRQGRRAHRHADGVAVRGAQPRSPQVVRCLTPLHTRKNAGLRGGGVGVRRQASGAAPPGCRCRVPAATQVVDLQKWWVFDGVPGSHKWQIMHEGLRLLQRGMALIHEKAEVRRRRPPSSPLCRSPQQKRLERHGMACCTTAPASSSTTSCCGARTVPKWPSPWLSLVCCARCACAPPAAQARRGRGEEGGGKGAHGGRHGGAGGGQGAAGAAQRDAGGRRGGGTHVGGAGAVQRGCGGSAGAAGAAQRSRVVVAPQGAGRRQRGHASGVQRRGAAEQNVVCCCVRCRRWGAPP